jgi:hypothetical protein
MKDESFKFEYKLRGDISKLKEKKLLGVFTSRHATSYSKKIIKEIVINFHETYCFMMTFETFYRLGLESELGTFVLIYDDESVNKVKKDSTLKVFLKNEISEFRLKYLYKDLFISNKSDNVLILEATKYSKNLNILALYAQELGKNVYVLPGRIDSESSKGANKLIFDGASPFYTMDLLKT